MNTTSWLYYTAMGEIVPVEPREGEIADRLYKRLKRLAKSYQRWERYFRVRRVGDVVLWQRVPAGLHTRLGEWHGLALGESFEISLVDAALELKRAKATARYLKASGNGVFQVRLEGVRLIVTRLADTAECSDHHGRISPHRTNSRRPTISRADVADDVPPRRPLIHDEVPRQTAALAREF